MLDRLNGQLTNLKYHLKSLSLGSLIKWGGLIIPMSLVFGCMSFAGMYLLFPSMIIGAVSFGLAVIIEGEVFKHNLNSFLAKLRQGIIKSVLLGLLFNQIKKDTKCLNNPLIQDLVLIRRNIRKLEEQLEHDHHHHHEHEHHEHNQLSLSKEELAKQLRFWRYREQLILDWLYKYLIKNSEEEFPVEVGNKVSAGIRDNLNNLKEQLGKSFLAKIERTRKLLIFTGVVAIFGVFPTTTAVSFYMLSQGLFAIGLTSLTIIAPLAVLGGAAYAFVLANAVSNMLRDDGFRNFWQNLYKKCSENKAWIIVLVVLAALWIFSSIASAGTWWYACKHLPKLRSAAIGMISLVINTVTAVYMLVFELANIVESLTEFWQSKVKIKEPILALWSEIKATWQKENVLQFFNPFRITKKILNGVIRSVLFIGHIISAAVTADNFLNKYFAAAADAAAELAVDAHAVLDLHGHDHSGPSDEELLTPDSDHQHSDFAKFVIAVPNLILSAGEWVWNKVSLGVGYVVGGVATRIFGMKKQEYIEVNHGVNLNLGLAEANKLQPTPTEPEKPQQLTYRDFIDRGVVKQKLTEEKERLSKVKILNSSLAQEKKAKVEQLKTSFSNNQSQSQSNFFSSNLNYDTLRKKRNPLGVSESTSLKTVKEVDQFWQFSCNPAAAAQA